MSLPADTGINSLREHVRRARAAVSDPAIVPTRLLVVGNESADCDSIVSALVLSYGLQKRLSLSHRSVESSSTGDFVFVPVLNLEPDDFALRTEVAELFAHLGWSVEDFKREAVFRSGLETARTSKTPIVLVDHNRLAAFQEDLEGQVCAVVDHHVDEGRCLGASNDDSSQSTDSARAVVRELLGRSGRIIQMVGSCSTLVAELCGNAQHGDGAPPGGPAAADDDPLLPNELVQMLMAAILLDTANFDPDMKKATEKDVQVALALARQLGWSDARGEGTHFTSSAAKAFGDQLGRWRFDVSRLSSRDCLRQDYKQFTMAGKNIGIASVRRSVSAWIELEGGPAGFTACLDSFAQEHSLDLLCAMIVYTDNSGFHRELVLYSRDEALLKLVTERVTNVLEPDPNLDLVLIPGTELASDGRFAVAYVQRNLNGSRKQLQPILTRLLE